MKSSSFSFGPKWGTWGSLLGSLGHPSAPHVLPGRSRVSFLLILSPFWASLAHFWFIVEDHFRHFATLVALLPTRLYFQLISRPVRFFKIEQSRLGACKEPCLVTTRAWFNTNYRGGLRETHWIILRLPQTLKTKARRNARSG